MKAAWYEKPGAARDVLTVGEMPDPTPGPGEVRIRVSASGINQGDTKKRADIFALGMPYPRVIPHSDGAGTVDLLGAGVSQDSQASAYGASGRSRTGRSAPRHNTRLCLRTMSSPACKRLL